MVRATRSTLSWARAERPISWMLDRSRFVPASLSWQCWRISRVDIWAFWRVFEFRNRACLHGPGGHHLVAHRGARRAVCASRSVP